VLAAPILALAALIEAGMKVRNRQG
jgi:hypothetical protein